MVFRVLLTLLFYRGKLFLVRRGHTSVGAVSQSWREAAMARGTVFYTRAISTTARAVTLESLTE